MLTPIQLRTRRAKRALAARGMVEAVTWSFISKPHAELFGGGQAELALANPIAADLSDMRPSLLPGLSRRRRPMPIAATSDVALFEVGQIFKGDKPEDQFIAASGVRHGFASSKGMGRHWSGSARPTRSTPRPMRSPCLPPPARRCRRCRSCRAAPSWLHPGRSGTIQIGPQNVLGYFGELHPRTLEALGADGPLMAFEVILDRIPDAKQKPTRAKPLLELSAFQPVSRDFAFIVDRSVKAGDIVRAAQGVDKKLITDVTVFDVYEGKGIDRRQEVDRDRRDDPAAREDADRSGDRRGGGEDRGRGDEEDRRHVCADDPHELEASFRPTSASTRRSRSARSPSSRARRADFPASARR